MSQSIPQPSFPDPPKAKAKIGSYLMIGLLNLFSPIVLLYMLTAKYSAAMAIYQTWKLPSIRKHKHFKDDELLGEIFASEVGKRYYNAVEYQLREGYCAPTTTRCVLKSLIDDVGTDNVNVPDPVHGPSIPPAVAKAIDSCTNYKTKSTVVYGTDGYEEFLKALRLANSTKYRISVNYLRSPLFGPNSYLGHHLLFAFLGGHFSPIIGYVEDKNLVCLYDVNHNYGPMFIDAHRLYGACNTKDVMSGQSRGLVVTEVL